MSSIEVLMGSIEVLMSSIEVLMRSIEVLMRSIEVLMRPIEVLTIRLQCRAAVTSAVTSQGCCCGNLQIHPLDLGHSPF